jgi:hypothetical protein
MSFGEEDRLVCRRTTDAHGFHGGCTSQDSDVTDGIYSQLLLFSFNVGVRTVFDMWAALPPKLAQKSTTVTLCIDANVLVNYPTQRLPPRRCKTRAPCCDIPRPTIHISVTNKIRISSFLVPYGNCSSMPSGHWSQTLKSFCPTFTTRKREDNALIQAPGIPDRALPSETRSDDLYVRLRTPSPSRVSSTVSTPSTAERRSPSPSR